MKQAITFSTFRDQFQAIRPDNFTYKAQERMYEYILDLEDSTGEEIELDVIGLCCEFSEFENWEEFAQDYKDITQDNIRDHTTVIFLEADNFDKGFIISEF